MKNRFLPIIVCWIILLPFVLSYKARGVELPTGETHETGVTESSADEFVLLRIPFLSPHFADTPVALVNEEPITMRELAGSMAYQHGQGNEGPGEREKESLKLLNRLINSRLILEEAMNIGLDKTDTFIAEIEDFKLKTLQRELVSNQISGLEPNPAEVEDLYKKISFEAKLYSLTFELPEVANNFLNVQKDGDFNQLAQKYIEENKAKLAGTEQYVKLKDFKPQVSELLYSMEVGDVSHIFRTEEGFLLFKLLDKRFVEDPAAKEKAFSIVFQSQAKQKAVDYGKALEDKYVTLDKALFDQLDFDQDYEKLKDDKRVLATVEGMEGNEPVKITVADLASELDVKSYHGADKAQQVKKLNERKELVLSNMLFNYTGKLEAHHLGLDQKEEFQRKVTEYERSKLFEVFMNKLILPDARLTAEEVRSYYDEHIDEYSSPGMLRMNSLVFDNRQDAESALDKLRKGADFNWVSANASGLVASDAEGILSFDKMILSLTALPEDLQQDAKGWKKGDFFLYAPSDGEFSYVLDVKDVFPPEPQPYEEAKQEVANVVFNMKVIKLQDEWIAKLKEVYPTQIFLINSKE